MKELIFFISLISLFSSSIYAEENKLKCRENIKSKILGVDMTKSLLYVYTKLNVKALNAFVKTPVSLRNKNKNKILILLRKKLHKYPNHYFVGIFKLCSKNGNGSLHNSEVYMTGIKKKKKGSI